jgi:hypothetical protein
MQLPWNLHRESIQDFRWPLPVAAISNRAGRVVRNSYLIGALKLADKFEIIVPYLRHFPMYFNIESCRGLAIFLDYHHIINEKLPSRWDKMNLWGVQGCSNPYHNGPTFL